MTQNFIICGHCEVNRSSRWSQKGLKSLFLQFYSLSYLFKSLIKGGFIWIYSSKHIFWYQIYVSTSLWPCVQDLLTRWGGNLGLFLLKIRQGSWFLVLLSSKTCKMFFLWFIINLLNETSLLVPHSCLYVFAVMIYWPNKWVGHENMWNTIKYSQNGFFMPLKIPNM